ncbi:MAG: hypothetical protein HKM95_13565 [Inquilinus sp.]|nr:hypothetical protein [Inquilinus sp.]
MKRGIYLFLFGVLVGIALGIWFAGFLEIDRCLDRGGRWDRGSATCDLTPVDGG